MTPVEITLPPGCLLRKANSSDRLDLKQLERKTMIEIFPEFLSFLLVMNILVALPLLRSNPFLVAAASGGFWIPYIFGLTFMFFNNKTFWFDLSNTWHIKCQGRLVAGITLHRGTKGLEIRSLFVEKKWRRRGLGSALVRRLIQETHPPIFLNCSHGLVSFYSRLGFVQYGSNMCGLPYMIYR
jgi:GNAT superfamily N-acetyltransferase